MGCLGNLCRSCRLFWPSPAKLSRLGGLCVKFRKIRLR